MNLILAHIGPDIPGHLPVCLRQVRRFYGGNIFAILNQRAIDVHGDDLRKMNCSLFSVEELLGAESSVRFLRRASVMGGNFWVVTMQRMMLVEALTDLLGLTDIMHIENDVLIYQDPTPLASRLHAFVGNAVGMTTVGPTHDSTAIIFAKDAGPIRAMNNLILSMLDLPHDQIARITRQSILSEMTIVRALRDRHPGFFKELPVLPSGEHSNGVTELGVVFDSASWGQYLGGIPGGSGAFGPGMRIPEHWIGKAIDTGDCDVKWENGRPWIVRRTGETTPLFNAHIHCKRLEEFTGEGR